MPSHPYRNGYAHMVLDDYVARLRDIYARRRARLAAVQTPAQAEAYQCEARAAIRQAFTPWSGLPSRTPLHPHINGVIQRDDFCIERLTFESRPGCLVTANLYLPCGLDAPAPCVLAPCGHAAEGKAYELYQAFCQRLAMAGFVVLIYDPFSQGEREQYHGLACRPQVGWGTQAHNMMGKQLDLLGDSFAFWRTWDGIRALDYLLSRPEIDPTRVGLTGNSGGGTLTTWLWALDDRFTMAAPNCFITSFLSNLENELPADAEQCPPGVIAAGLDMADFMIAQSPKPAILLGERYDFFDRRGLFQAYQDIRSFYDALGAGDRVELWIGDRDHGYHEPSQQAMVEFFCRHARMPMVWRDAAVPLPAADLWATPTGQVMELGATPAYELIAAQACDIAATRPAPDDETLRSRLADLLNLPARSAPPHYRIPRPLRQGDPAWARFAVETEGPVRAILFKLLRPSDSPFTLDVELEARLYVPHISAQADLAENEWAKSLTQDLPLYALDVRGLGESLPEEERGGFLQPYGMDYMFHAYGLMLNQSYLGRRVYDLLRVIDLLIGEGAQCIDLYGRGQGAILAALAALFHPQVESVTLQDAPRSFFEWTQTPYVAWPAANCGRGILHVADLPDMLRILGRRATVLGHWDATMSPLH